MVAEDKAVAVASKRLADSGGYGRECGILACDIADLALGRCS